MDEILELEHAGWRSLCDGSAADFYGSIMTADAQMLLVRGVVMSRDDVVATLQYAPPWASYEIADPLVMSLSAHCALLRYVGTGHRDDGSSVSAVMATVYVRQDDGWKLANYQQTLIE